MGFLFSLLKGIYNTCAIQTQVNRQASVPRKLFAGFFGIFSSSLNNEYDEGFDMTTGKKFDPYATHHLINEDTSYIPVNLRKSAGNPGGRIEPYDSESTRLQELSLMNINLFWRNTL